MTRLFRSAPAPAALLMILMPWAAAAQPVRVGVAGLTHGHVSQILGPRAGKEITIVGIAEPNRELARRLSERFGFSMDIVFPTVAEMLDQTKPQAVAAYNSIAGHRHVVEESARRGVHVMVEKPLAFRVEDARAMRDAATAAGIHLITNYETTWYGSIHELRRIVGDGQVGDLRKIVVRDGHSGPKEIGVSKEFFEWLTDPQENGGGAIIDFGCYGAGLITWLMDGAPPLAVTAVTQRMKPDIYPNVDDEATILIEYPRTQGIIEASWNWPFSRKDMDVYGATGYVKQLDPTRMRLRLKDEKEEKSLDAPPRQAPFLNPFSYFAAVVRGEVDPAGSLSSLELNMVVVDILDAARTSSRTGRRVPIKPE